MNETLGSNIMRLRKENDYTQEQLATILGISYQAVSKWENGIASPDISNLPLLADVFGVSIDELFGREAPAPKAQEPAPAPLPEAPEPPEPLLPWPDDETLHVALFMGHKLVGADEKRESLFSRRNVEFHYDGPALNIESAFSVHCGAVQGDVTAGGDVDCEQVLGSVQAGGDVDCGDVCGNVRADGDVDCGTVAGSVNAGGDVDCGSVGCDVTAGGDVDCGKVHGRVFHTDGKAEEKGEEDFVSNLKDKKRGFSFELKL